MSYQYPKNAAGANNTCSITQVVVPATANGILIAAANTARGSLTIVNHGAVDVYLYTDNTITTGKGILLVGSKGASYTFYSQTAVYGIVATGTQVVGVCEEYDV
jgi:hypothetical protein